MAETTDYLYGFQYLNSELQFFPHAEGYVKPNGTNSYLYVYQYKDHLGNVRLSYADVNGNGTVEPATEILEENNYYPFGLKHQGYNEIANSNRSEEAEAIKYNGKEYEDSFGLNIYEIDLRQYDPAIGRWVVQDPVIHHDYSPYSAFDNNPVYWSDPSGANSVRYNWGSGDYDVLDGNGKWVGSFDPSQFGDYQSNPEEFLQTFFSLELSAGENDNNGGGDGNGGGNGNRKTYEYKGEQYSSKEMLFADLLIETILEEFSYAYVYTVISALDAAGLIQKGFQMNGASSSTSYASKYLAPAIDKALKKMNLVNKSQLPTHFRGSSLRGTVSTGRFITRWNANIATAILIYQIGDIFNTTNMKYNYIINGPYKYERYKY